MFETRLDLLEYQLEKFLNEILKTAELSWPNNSPYANHPNRKTAILRACGQVLSGSTGKINTIYLEGPSNTGKTFFVNLLTSDLNRGIIYFNYKFIELIN